MSQQTTAERQLFSFTQPHVTMHVAENKLCGKDGVFYYWHSKEKTVWLVDLDLALKLCIQAKPLKATR